MSHSLIPSYNEDGGSVDLHELDGIDGHVILFRQVGLKFAWPKHHPEVQGKRRTSAPVSQRSRGMRSVPRRSDICSAVVVLDGGVCAFS
jgi:hypothetical protein